MRLELINYNDINDEKLKNLFLHNEKFVMNCKSCVNSWILPIKNNYLIIFEHKELVEIYIDHIIPQFNYTINYISKHIKKNVNIIVPIKIKNYKEIISQIIKLKHFNCPQISYISNGGILFKQPIVIFDDKPQKKCNTRNILDNIDKKFKQTPNSDFHFPDKDIKTFKKMLKKDYEQGGQIIRNGDSYSIDMKTIVDGDGDENIFLEPTAYNFHTHPEPLYENDNQSFAGWFSGVDIQYIINNIDFGLKEHFLVTPEGIYRLRLTKQFIDKYVVLPDNCKEKVVTKLYNIFAKLEDKRQDSNNVLSINSDTIRTFNDFFVFINSLNVSFLPNCFPKNSDFLLFDLDFQFW